MKYDTDAMRSGAPSFKELAEQILGVKTELQKAMTAAGSCWGNDKYGKQFHDDSGQGKGYGSASREFLEQVPNLASAVGNVESKIRSNAASVDGTESGTKDRYPTVRT